MSILVNQETRLLIQGITGREGQFHGQAMLDYGTPVVAGVTPGKGGQWTFNNRVPVFNTVADAIRETGANTSVIYVPAAFAPDAMLEAAAAGIGLIFCITEGIPALDMLRVYHTLRGAGRPAHWPQLSRRHVRRPGQGRDHPGQHPSAGHGRRGQPVGHADLRGGPGPDR